MLYSLRRRLTSPLVRALAFQGRKTYSAMVRVRNEEEFLYPAIASIANHVEQIVVVDNLSTDRTAEIIARLQREFPAQVEHYSYPHQIARPGAENVRLASTPAGLQSPRLLANFYNWCLERCREPFIIKWDGDTVALPAFLDALEAFRTAPEQAMLISGVNVHPLGRHTVKAQDLPDGNGEPWYVALGRRNQLRPYEDLEARIFPRRFARYTNALVYCESLRSPFIREGFTLDYEPLAYLHFKHCKRDIYTNISPNVKPDEAARWEVGEPLDEAALACMRHWQIDLIGRVTWPGSSPTSALESDQSLAIELGSTGGPVRTSFEVEFRRKATGFRG